MDHRRTAVLVGALFLTATVSGLIVVASWGPVLDASDPLAEVIGSDAQVRVGAFFELVMAVAVAAIALAMYPVLREHDETLALGYVVARGIEGAFIILPAITMLSLSTLGQGLVGSAGPADPSVIAAGEVVFAIGDWAGYAAVAIVFCLGALMFYTALYRARLVPRWLAGWGLLAAVIYLPAAAIAIAGRDDVATITNLPLALNEVVLALWLIVRGFEADRTTVSARASIARGAGA
jgi:hypothetical protein